MPKKLTHEEFLEKLKEKNEHYKNGTFEVISEYRNIYDIIEEIEIQDKNTIWLLEEQLKDILKDKKYIPLSEFGGYSECYKIENFKEIYEEFKKITENYIT